MICYVVAIWLGPRNSKSHSTILDNDPFYFVKKHLEFLSSLDKDNQIKEAIFVVNRFNSFIDENILNVVNQYKGKIPVEVVFRGNRGFSYGAWDEVVKKTLNRNYDYYFLIEDDYIPTSPEFYKIFLSKMNENVPYVTQLYKDKHAAISNGLLNKKIAYELYKVKKHVFKIDSNPTYLAAVENQRHFLKYLEEFSGDNIQDIAKDAHIPFFSSDKDIIIDYGNVENSSPLKPIDIPKFTFKLIKETDLEFVNNLRNTYAFEYLHDSRTFNLEQTKEWFTKTNPEFYIIEYLNKKIGYFRISNYSEQNKNLYIGADIHPLFAGKGLGYGAYKDFIPFIFEKYDLHKISLEVLSNNSRAIHLYEKLGFKLEGTKREEVCKNEIFIDSHIMSLLKEEFNA